MRRAIRHQTTLGLLLLVNVLTACHPSFEQLANSPANVTPSPTSQHAEDDPADLVKRINAFAEGEGDDATLQYFKSQPQDSLIASIERIRDNTEQTDPLRVKIAFLFCLLGHTYPKNRATVVGGFTHPQQYEEFYGDDAVGMMARLIREGDKDLLPVIFRAAKQADGALAEGLSATYIENVREDPSAFIRGLTRVDGEARKSVYELTGYSILTEEDFDRVKASLQSVSGTSKESSLAKEMLRFLSATIKFKT